MKRNQAHLPYACTLLLAVLTFLSVTMPRIHAQTVWTGTHINFFEPGTDPTDPTNQDRITDNVWLTRGANYPLFNAAKENFYNSAAGSPMDTEWAVGALTNWASLTFQPWVNVIGGQQVPPGPRNMVGVDMVVHLKTDNIYLYIKLTSWTRGEIGGGFSYERSTAQAAAPTVDLTSPTNNTVYASPAQVKLAADASIGGGPVDSVQFYADTSSLLGTVLTQPYALTNGSLAAGAHSLFAVASSAGNLATSGPVNITIVSPVTVTNSTPSLANGHFSFNYNANIGLAYSVERSSNSVNWLPIITNVASGTSVPFTDLSATNSLQFYRVRRQPNP